MPDFPGGCGAIQVLEMILVGSRQGDPDAMALMTSIPLSLLRGYLRRVVNY